MTSSTNWIDLSRDADTGIETLRAHFKGHAYDPHWHPSYLVGLTEQGIQQFNCRKQKVQSTPGKVFLLEPGEMHDGESIRQDGFTYRMLYIDPEWLEQSLSGLFEQVPVGYIPGFDTTLSQDPQLAQAISDAFEMLHYGEIRMVKQSAIDTLLATLTRHVAWRANTQQSGLNLTLAERAREYIHAHMYENIGLDDLSVVLDTDRFTLTRAFKQRFGQPPHTYLVQLKLTHARLLLAKGMLPIDVSTIVGFADQSHMGRWFRKAYRLTPSHYRKLCLQR